MGKRRLARVLSIAEALQRTRPSAFSFDLAILGRGVGLERRKQPRGNGRDLIDRRGEGRFVGLRRLGEAADLAYELQRSGVDLFVGCDRLEVEECLDVPA